MEHKLEIFSKKNIKIIFFALASILIFGIQLRHLNILNTPWIYDDEFGYWSNAAYLAGYDWSETTKFCAYYSYGYSFVLVPLFWLKIDPLQMYKMAIMLNAVMTAGMFILAFDVLRVIGVNANFYLKLLIAAAGTLTAAVFLQSQTAWSETLLVFMVWIITDLFLRYIYFGKVRYLAGFVFGNVYIYMIHQRTLGVVISSIIMLGGWLITKKKRRPQILAVCAIGIGLIAASFIKKYLQINLWKIGESTALLTTSNVNDYESVLARCKMILLDNEYRMACLKEFLGVLFYFVRTTYFMLIFLAYFWIKETIQMLKIKKQGSVLWWVNSYILLSVIAMIGITSIFSATPDRNDGYIYGRYAEVLAGVVIVFAIINICKSQLTIKEICIIWMAVTVEILLGFVVNSRWNIHMGTFNLNIASTSRYIVENKLSLDKLAMEIKMIAALLSAVWVFGRKSFWKKQLFLAIFSSVCIFISYKDSEYVFKEQIVHWQQQKIGIIEAAEYIRDNMQEQARLYYKMDGNFHDDGNKNTIQFLFPECRLQCIVTEEWQTTYMDENGIYIASKRDPMISDFKAKENIVFENQEVIVFSN